MTAGCYRVECIHEDGRSVSREGVGTDSLEADCIEDAINLPERRRRDA